MGRYKLSFWVQWSISVGIGYEQESVWIALPFIVITYAWGDDAKGIQWPWGK